MTTRSILRFSIAVAACLVGLFRRSLARGRAKSSSNRGSNISNPDGQHLQLNLARPKTARRGRRRSSCIHGGGFRPAPRGLDDLCHQAGPAGLRRGDGHLSSRSEIPFPAAVLRQQGGGALAAGQRQEVPHRSGADRRHRRFGRRPSGAVPRRDRAASRSSRATAATPSSRAAWPAS